MTTPTLTPNKAQKAMDKLIAMSADEIDLPVTPNTITISREDAKAILDGLALATDHAACDTTAYYDVVTRIRALLEGK